MKTKQQILKDRIEIAKDGKGGPTSSRTPNLVGPNLPASKINPGGMPTPGKERISMPGPGLQPIPNTPPKSPIGGPVYKPGQPIKPQPLPYKPQPAMPTTSQPPQYTGPRLQNPSWNPPVYKGPGDPLYSKPQPSKEDLIKKYGSKIGIIKDQIGKVPSPKIDYGNAPQGTQLPTDPLPSGGNGMVLV